MVRKYKEIFILRPAFVQDARGAGFAPTMPSSQGSPDCIEMFWRDA